MFFSQDLQLDILTGVDTAEGSETAEGVSHGSSTFSGIIALKTDKCSNTGSCDSGGSIFLI
jgi:hypothetical protein